MATVKIELTQNGHAAVVSAFDKVRSAVTDVVKSLAPMAVAAVGITKLSSAFTSIIPDTQELAMEVNKLQRITGMTAESASEMIAVSDQVGVSFGALENAVVQISRKMGGLKDIQDMVIDASGETVDVFEKFGIEVKNQDGSLKSFSDVFEQISHKIQSASTAIEKMAIATQFFKGSASELMPLLTMSREQWRELAEDAGKYGLILSQDNVTAVRQYVYAQRDLDDAISGLRLEIGNALLPVMKEMSIDLTGAIKNVKDFTHENRALLSLPFDTLKAVKDDFENIATAVGLMVAPSIAESIGKIIEKILIMDVTARTTQAGLAGLFAALGYYAGTKLDFEANKAYAQEANAIKDLAEQKEFLKKREEQLKQATEAEAKAHQVNEEAIKVVRGAVEQYADVIKNIGEDTLKFGGDEFTRNLKDQSQSIDGMRQSMSGYLTVMDQVYNKRIQALTVLNHEVGMEIQITEIQKAQAVARLTAWTQYYDAVTALHVKAIDMQKQKSDELLKVEQSIRQARITTDDLILSIQQKAMSESERYYSSIDNLENKYNAAMKLSGDEKTNMLRSLQQSWTGLTDEIQDNGQTIIMAADAQKYAIDWIRALGNEIVISETKKKTALEQEIAIWKGIEDQSASAMSKATEMMGLYKSQVLDLGNQLNALQMDKTLHVEIDQAQSAIDTVKGMLQSLDPLLFKNLTVTTTVNGAAAAGAGAGFSSGNSMAGLHPLPEFDVGTNFVQRTGLAIIHRGEEIKPAKYVERDRQNRQMNITFAPNITITGNNKDARQLAREIARPLRDELKRLEYMS